MTYIGLGGQEFSDTEKRVKLAFFGLNVADELVELLDLAVDVAGDEDFDFPRVRRLDCLDHLSNCVVESK